MIEIGTKITITASDELTAMRLAPLAGRRGTVVEKLLSPRRRQKGYMIRLTTKYLEEYVWYIPAESVAP